MSANLELCEQLFDAIMRGDIEAVREVYAEDAVIWHNNDGAEQTPEENLRVLRWVIRNVKDLRYEEIRRHETAVGFVQQHVLRGMAPNGIALEIPACIVCTVNDGQIMRVEEYLDSAHTSALRG